MAIFLNYDFLISNIDFNNVTLVSQSNTIQKCVFRETYSAIFGPQIAYNYSNIDVNNDINVTIKIH
jgi:hypothetical protein